MALTFICMKQKHYFNSGDNNVNNNVKDTLEQGGIGRGGRGGRGPPPNILVGSYK